LVNTIKNAIIGNPDGDIDITEQDWAAYSAGFEAGLREGIARTRLLITVELAPVGPANAGLKLWRAVTSARLAHRTESGSQLSGGELRERARRSWGLPARERDERRGSS
jgi:hypothetical protein